MNKVPVTQSSPKSSFIPLCAFILPYGVSGSSELHSIVPTFSSAYVCRLPIHLCIHEALSLISRHIFHLLFLSHSIHWFLLHWCFSLLHVCSSLALSLSLLLWAFSCHPLSSHLPHSISVTFYLSFSPSLFSSHPLVTFPITCPWSLSRNWTWPNSPLLRLMYRGLGAIAIAGCS